MTNPVALNLPVKVSTLPVKCGLLYKQISCH